MDSNHEYIKKIYEKYLSEKDYILAKYKYRVVLFGEYSSGKSSLLNALIGKDILPESSGHCTKVILIIQYVKYEKDISLYSSKFYKKNSNSLINYFIQDKLITKGEESVKNQLKVINNNSKGGISYYIINTPIKFLDQNFEDEKIKEKIQFFDLPGLDSLIKEYTESDFPELMEHINLFIYTNGKNILLQNESESAIKKMLEFILDRKEDFNLDSIIFIINFYDKLEIINKVMFEQIMQKFKDDIYKIIKKFKESDWNRYINNYSRKIDKKEKNLCFFFSQNIFQEEQRKIYEILDFNNFFTKLNQEYSNYNMKKKIKEIKKYIQNNYIKKLNNQFSSNGIKIDLNSPLDKYRNNLKSILKIQNSQFYDNQENINSIVIMYDFFLKNKSNYIYTFNDFLTILKVKFSQENIHHFLKIIFNMSLNLFKTFKLIENNIFRWKSNSSNSQNTIKVKNKLSKIHEDCIAMVESEFNTKTEEIRNNLSKMMNGEDKLEEIFKAIKDLLNNIEIFYHSYFKKMKKEMIKFEENILLDFDAGVMVLIDYKTLYIFYGTFGGLLTSILTISYAAYGMLGIPVETAFFTATFSSGAIGGIIGIAIGGLCSLIIIGLSFLISKLISQIKNREEILRLGEQIMTRLEAIQYKMKKEIDLLYFSSDELLKETILSQEKPIKNIIENENNLENFHLLKKQYEEYLKRFNKKA